MPSFSQRYGFAQPPEVTVREELPSSLRGPIVEIASRRTGATRLRKIVESVLDPYGTNPLPVSPAAGMAGPVDQGANGPHRGEGEDNGVLLVPGLRHYRSFPSGIGASGQASWYPLGRRSPCTRFRTRHK